MTDVASISTGQVSAFIWVQMLTCVSLCTAQNPYCNSYAPVTRMNAKCLSIISGQLKDDKDRNSSPSVCHQVNCCFISEGEIRFQKQTTPRCASSLSGNVWNFLSGETKAELMEKNPDCNLRSRISTEMLVNICFLIELPLDTREK